MYLFAVFVSLFPLVYCLPNENFPGSSDEVTSLPGVNFKLPFRHYSGYLTSENGSHLHYWLFESQNNSAKDPVVLWLTGGPGCSSLLGALTEQGPILMSDDGQFVVNPFAWNLRTNLLFLESPAGVGFSYNEAHDYKTDDRRTAMLNFVALKSFFHKFPHFAHNDLYITGESYAGVYVPTLASHVLENKLPVNFKGFAIGNGYLDQTMLGNSFLLFTYYHGLYDTDLWEAMREHCCEGISDLEKCDFVNNQEAKCKTSIAKVHNKLDQSRLNWFNIYATCNRSSVSGRKNLLTPYQLNRQFVAKNLLQLDKYELSEATPCYDYDYLIDWINRKNVRRALHITDQSPEWIPCGNIDYTNQYKSLTKIVRHLLNSGLKGLIYNGDVDTACNYLGDLWFSQKLGFKTVREFSPWEYDGQVAGYEKVYDTFTFTTIHGSGHMVPLDKPGAALEMFHKFLDS